MQFSKSQKSNLILFGVLALIFFTPLRGIVQEYGARLLSFSPSVENINDRVAVENYHWELKGINTEDYNFSKNEGKVVLVNFWATWCPPCRAEMPSLQSLFDDYKGKVEFVFVTNENVFKVQRFLKKKNYDLPSYVQNSYAPKEFTVSSIPATFILDKRGKIVVHKVGPADWNGDKVRSLLDELIKN